jgi:hypothetical protein
MSIPSNLYAERIFAEQPLVLWSLDDPIDYISLISEAQRDLSSAAWSATGVTRLSRLSSQEPYGPIATATTKFYKTTPTSSSGAMTVSSTFTEDFDLSSVGPVTVGMYFYSYSPYITSVDVNLGSYSDTVLIPTDGSVPIIGEWHFLAFQISHTSDITSATISIDVNYSANSVFADSHDFAINGLSVGYSSEDFHVTSLGGQDVEILEDMPLILNGVESKAYGLGGRSAYYVSDSERLCATNSGMPLVFGSFTSTIVSENQSGNPSLILPGYGFLNESGKYRKLTFEGWFRISSRGTTPRRIFGPISGTNGLYVDNSFLRFKVGKYVISHFVGEWSRPMLIQLSITQDRISMILNGEQVAATEVILEDVDFEPYLSDGNINDWLGVYAYSDIPTLNIDCFAVYPDIVADVVAKRRYAYGAAVAFPEGLSRSQGGEAVMFDYPFANYSNNYNFGSAAKNQWTDGTIENLEVSSNVLSAPKYGLPQTYITTGTNSGWLQDVASLQTTSPHSIRLKPTEDNRCAFILFDQLKLSNANAAYIYGVFKAVSADSATNLEKTLFKLQDPITKDYIEAIYKNGSVIYRSNIGGVEDLGMKTFTASVGSLFSVGINFESMSNANPNMKAFFSLPQQLVLYVGGNKENISMNPSTTTPQTFDGHIYRFGIGSKKNYSRIDSALSVAITDADGMFSNESALHTYLSTFRSSYTLFLNNVVDNFVLDVSINGRWQTYIPLQSLAKSIALSSGTSYDLNFIQFNIQNPEPNLLDGTDVDTSLSLIKSYISFQSIASGANADPDEYTTVPLDQGKVVLPDSLWEESKYELVDGSIVYLPSNEDNLVDNYAAVISIDFDLDGVISNPTNLRSLQVSSKALDESTTNPIGTRFGIDVVPYAITDGEYNYDSTNPILIGKSVAPYLTLTSNSGISVSGIYNPEQERGFYIEINKNLSEEYSVSAVQIFARFFDNAFPTTERKIAEIENENGNISLYVQSVGGDNSTANIFARDENEDLVTDINWFVNGSFVSAAVVEKDEWAAIGIEFQTPINLDGIAAKLKVCYPFLVNNISWFQSQPSQTTQIQEPGVSWGDVLYNGASGRSWSTISGSTWASFANAAAITRTVESGISPEDVYKTYTGTNKFIVGTDPESSQVSVQFGDYEYSAYLNTYFVVNKIVQSL